LDTNLVFVTHVSAVVLDLAAQF